MKVIRNIQVKLTVWGIVLPHIIRILTTDIVTFLVTIFSLTASGMVMASWLGYLPVKLTTNQIDIFIGINAIMIFSIFSWRNLKKIQKRDSK